MLAEKLLRGNDRGQGSEGGEESSGKESATVGERQWRGEKEEQDDEILVSSSVFARIRTMAETQSVSFAA